MSTAHDIVVEVVSYLNELVPKLITFPETEAQLMWIASGFSKFGYLAHLVLSRNQLLLMLQLHTTSCIVMVAAGFELL